MVIHNKLKLDAAIIFGSARSNGNTQHMISKVYELDHLPLFDLSKLNIGPFDYTHANLDDDFIPTIQKLLGYKAWIMATPVYWYSMSGYMKTFLDRFTDLITIKKELGYQLKKKQIMVLANYGGAKPSKCFGEVFQEFCNYLGITYLGCFTIYGGSGKDSNQDQIDRVMSKLS